MPSSLYLIMLGPPGAGKGTQAERLARRHGVPKISTGDILREAVHAGTDIGKRAAAVIDRGELVSDEVMIGIVRERLDRDDARAGFVLDGFPRTVGQAVALDSLMRDRGPLLVVHIAVPEHVLTERLHLRLVCEKCGANAVPAADAAGAMPTRCQRCGGELVQRSDDGEAVVGERLKVYLRDTKPLVEYYRARPTLRSIDGAQPLETVTAALEAAVASMAGA